MNATNHVSNMQGMDRDEYIRIMKLHESTPLIMIPETGPTETMRVRVNNTLVIKENKNDIL
jgi:hypothetical protein